MGEYIIDWVAVAAIIAASVALYGSWRANKIADKNLSLSAELEIIKFREKWISELRENMGNYLSQVASFDAVNINDMNAASHKISLLISSSDPEYDAMTKQMSILSLRAAEPNNPTHPVYLHLRDEVDNEEDFSPNILQSIFKNVLKREWEKIKLDIDDYRKKINAKNK